jgi:hypothetical protein
MRRWDRRAIGAGGAVAALLGSAAIAAGQDGGYPGGGAIGPNPCVGAEATELRCPNLRMAPPKELYVTRGKGKVLLHATNNIKSRGEGPLEVRGKRIPGTKRMRVRQMIYTTAGTRDSYATNARLVFYNIPGQGPYWKFHLAARFEIWSLDGQDRRKQLVRKGPKLNFCFRDLERTKPSPRSPKGPVYPACSQDPSKRYRTLGTSVGWSDIYPSSYYQNWINVRGLRGCFAFVHRADPSNLLYENDEGDNTDGRRIRLPIKGRIRGCKR